MSIMQVDVVSNEESIYSGEASFAVVPTFRADEISGHKLHTQRQAAHHGRQDN